MRFLSPLPLNKWRKRNKSKWSYLEPQQAERDLPNHLIQLPHFTGEKTPKRLNGRSKVTRLLSGVDGTWTQAFGRIVQCSFHYSPTSCSALAKKAAPEVKYTIWALNHLSPPPIWNEHLLRADQWTKRPARARRTPSRLPSLSQEPKSWIAILLQYKSQCNQNCFFFFLTLHKSGFPAPFLPHLK